MTSQSPFSAFTELYSKNFGPFLTKFNLGGTLSTEDKSVEA